MNNEKISRAVAGVEVDLFLLDGAALVRIGGQAGAKLTRSTKTQDITTKEDRGKTKYIVISDEWRVECNGFYKVHDKAIELLHDAFLNQTELAITLKMSNEYTLTGMCVLDSFPQEFPEKGNVKYTLSLIGASELEKKEI